MTRHAAPDPDGAPRADPAAVERFVADSDLLTTMESRGLVVRRPWWQALARRPVTLHPVRPGQYPVTFNDPQQVTAFFADQVADVLERRLADRGLVPARQQTLAERYERLGPRGELAAGAAAAVLVLAAIALAVLGWWT